MVLNVPTCREEIGDPWIMYSFNHDISPIYFLARVEKREDLLGGGRIVSWI